MEKLRQQAADPKFQTMELGAKNRAKGNVGCADILVFVPAPPPRLGAS